MASKFKIAKIKGKQPGMFLFKIYQDDYWVGTARTRQGANTIINRRKLYRIKAR